MIFGACFTESKKDGCRTNKISMRNHGCIQCFELKLEYTSAEFENNSWTINALKPNPNFLMVFAKTPLNILIKSVKNCDQINNFFVCFSLTAQEKIYL